MVDQVHMKQGATMLIRDNVVHGVLAILDRLQLPDAEALELIASAGKIGPSGKRPQFRLSTRQTHLAFCLPEIEQHSTMSEHDDSSVVQKNRRVPFAARRSS